MPPADPNADLLPHEIAGPVWYLPYPLPVMIALGVLTLLLVALAAWALIAWRRRVNRRPLTARQRALADLAAARGRAEVAAPYEFSIEVCDILRNFLGSEHHLPATTQTSYEFLQTARGSGVFDDVRLGGLTRFLDKADAIKFARADATAADNAELAGLAEELVQGEPTHAVAA
ncbi:MAG: hypothetical protein ACO39C_01465 [Chthoniobacterales bacterium]|jgi:hypothetical protein